MSALPSTIETERLRLRRPRLDDADAVFHTWASDPEVARYMAWRTHASVDESRAFVARCVEGWERGSGHLAWIIETREDARVAGVISATLEGDAPVGGAPAALRASIGYGLGRAFWGRGFMTEAARAVVDRALALPAVFRVWAVCDVDNAASARVLEKVGMRFEGVLARWCVHPNLSPEPRDCRCYAIVR